MKEKLKDRFEDVKDKAYEMAEDAKDKMGDKKKIMEKEIWISLVIRFPTWKSIRDENTTAHNKH